MSLKVEDFMTEKVISVSEKTKVTKAAELMSKHEIGCVVVLRKGKPVGILTERDMVKRVVLGFIDPRYIEVGDIMSKPVVVGGPQMDIDEASKIMLARKIKKLPVVDSVGRLVGLVTTTDIIRSPETTKMMIRAIKRNLFKEITMLIQNKMELERS